VTGSVWPAVHKSRLRPGKGVLALVLATLGGRAADAPNLVLAGVMIAMIPPVTVFLLAQRCFVENVASSGIKG
jgi:alpha-1,4-digalacturonate transport system permease protein